MVRRYFLLGVVLAVALGLIVATYFLARQWETNRIYGAFRGIASDRANAVEEQLRDQLFKIEYLRAVYRSSDEAQEDDLGLFVQEFRRLAQEAFADDTEIRTVAYAPRVTEVSRKAVTAWLRFIDNDFEIVEMDQAGRIITAPSRPEYYPMVAAEPVRSNARLRGLDLLTDPNAREAMERALETGEVIAAPPALQAARMLSPNDFRVFVALQVAMPTTIPDGYIMLSLKVDQIIKSALSGNSPAGVDIFFYDHGQTDTLLYTHGSRTRTLADPIDANGTAPFELQMELPAASRTWRVVARPAPAFFENQTYTLANSVLAGGLLSTTILVVFLLLFIRRSIRIEGLVAERTEQLTREVESHKAAEDALKVSQERTTNAVLRTNRHIRKIELLSEMGELLQTCRSLEEAYEVTARFVQRLFPNGNGTLQVFHESRKYLETVASWGDHPIDEAVLLPDQCWALRRGKVHVSSERDLICPHIIDYGLVDRPHLCLPLVAQGETLGVIHLTSTDPEVATSDENSTSIDGTTGFGETLQRLGSAAAEHAALAIANIRLRETLRQQSVRDPLTGLFNRRHMEESLDREIHRALRSESRLGLVVIDIDFFKRFNDEHGHDAGDRVLKAVAEFLERSVRQEDIVCRFGGEEFVLVLPGASQLVTSAKSEELREGVQSVTVETNGGVLPGITISAGVAMLGGDISTRDELFGAADQALYRAKAAGRNCVRLHGDDTGENGG